MKYENLFLKLTIILMTLVTLFIFMVCGSALAKNMLGERTPDPLPYIGLEVLVGITAILFLGVLREGYKLLKLIDKRRAFSRESVTSLMVIKRIAFVIGLLYVLFLPALYFVAQYEDAPGIILMGAFAAGAAFVVMVFAAVLRRLLEQALEIKAENELTI
ncbi:DUF2975 domain-containing protein [Ohessyouella blattaphilus]|uniref:DUF2975 domain-containing protein n=1 Tax=Ohessyouella blattaphilus TaxID=2949333 RepID=A0ABT1EKN6_9FIRM|nr:DUF2975 domain-containing protein [Ohessyouella blattaphilus]MCP1111264.1 DUF2975 domain-containing protein [Ohessyouella blattaphilus]MCR8564658.1 DUF2975 domain-containing protein [Ohessyouella blattaphilus]